MRVTHVITRLIVGGAQENTVSSVVGLLEKPGLKVDLISGPTRGPEGSLEPVFKDRPGVLRVLPELVRPIRPWQDLVALRKLTGILRKEGPSIVHTHSGKAGVVGRIAAHKAGVPIIIHTIHGPSFGPFQSASSNFVFRNAEKWAGRYTTHFVVVADAMRDQYLQAGIGSHDQYTKILSGFNLDPFLQAKNGPGVRSALGLAPDDIVIGKIARITALKGHEDIFAVAPELVRRRPKVRFLLVGDGDLRGYFEGKARELGLTKHFFFTGLVRPSEVSTYVGVMDVLVHLSRREGLPRALPQGMAAAKPVVAYDCDGAREVCIENQTGFLLKPGDREMLGKRLGQLAADSSLRARLGENGRKEVISRFSVQQMVDSLYDLYVRLSSR